MPSHSMMSPWFRALAVLVSALGGEPTQNGFPSAEGPTSVDLPICVVPHLDSNSSFYEAQQGFVAEQTPHSLSPWAATAAPSLRVDATASRTHHHGSLATTDARALAAILNGDVALGTCPAQDLVPPSGPLDSLLSCPPHDDTASGTGDTHGDGDPPDDTLVAVAVPVDPDCDLLEAAKAAARAGSIDDRILNTLAMRLDATSPVTSTRRAIHAALLRLAAPDLHSVDRGYYASTGASRTNYRRWLQRLRELQEYCDALNTVVDDTVVVAHHHPVALVAPADGSRALVALGPRWPAIVPPVPTALVPSPPPLESLTTRDVVAANWSRLDREMCIYRAMTDHAQAVERHFALRRSTLKLCKPLLAPSYTDYLTSSDASAALAALDRRGVVGAAAETCLVGYRALVTVTTLQRCALDAVGILGLHVVSVAFTVASTETVAGPSVIYCDSKSAVDMAYDPVSFRKTKHILRAAEFLRDLVAREAVRLEHVAGAVMLADILTKAQARPVFMELLRLMRSYSEARVACPA